MLHTLQQLLAPAALERLTLLVNHVLGSEAAATQRLLPHVGKVVQLELASWPSLLLPLPPLCWRISPAGLLEWCGAQNPAGAELRVSLAADNPALALARGLLGELPPVTVAGDAQLAGELNWLMQNLRWDRADDLARVFPPPLAQGLHQAGTALAHGLKTAAQTLDTLRRAPSGR